jgi:hypothetical protein
MKYCLEREPCRPWITHLKLEIAVAPLPLRNKPKKNQFLPPGAYAH